MPNTRTFWLTMMAAFLFPQAAMAGDDHAPELVGGPWLNTKDSKPVTLASRKGKVTLVAFWTFDCVNCRNNMAPYARLLKEFRPKGVELLSVHTPELDEEHDVSLIKKHIAEFKIDYPVVVDNDNANWNKWGVKVWPSLYLVDKQGNVRYHWFGELNYNGAGGEAKVGRMLEQLLTE